MYISMVIKNYHISFICFVCLVSVCGASLSLSPPFWLAQQPRCFVPSDICTTKVRRSILGCNVAIRRCSQVVFVRVAARRSALSSAGEDGKMDRLAVEPRCEPAHVSLHATMHQSRTACLDDASCEFSCICKHQTGHASMWSIMTTIYIMMEAPVARTAELQTSTLRFLIHTSQCSAFVCCPASCHRAVPMNALHLTLRDPSCRSRSPQAASFKPTRPS